MTALQTLLTTYRQAAVTEREKGTYFEELIIQYLRNEASYQDLYSDVWSYADWADYAKLDKRDTGIDLVARTFTGDYHAIQCKFYDANYRVQKSDIDSFFTASGKKPFVHRVIVVTSNNWSEHADDALQDQQPPVSKIDLNDLENSQIDWSHYQAHFKVTIKEKKQLRAHQQTALHSVMKGLSTADRGKMIMACGTGKTFTSLKIAEAIAGAGKRVLFLVPSLSLLSQTLTEWTQESAIPLHSFAVCSDSDVGKKRKKDDDIVQTFTHELRYPATTKPDRLAHEMLKRHDTDHMSVVFSTYHSIAVISTAQQQYGLADFDLIVCDEAHRTTGATFDIEDESAFVKVHDADYIRAHKRLYMTATPRIYGEVAKITAEKDHVALCSMDDEALYGKELYVITFSDAVQRGLLVDYKVLVLAVDEKHVSARLQALLADDNSQIKVDDAAKIIGCWKALSKQDVSISLTDDEQAMQRAVAFCQVIDPITQVGHQKRNTTHKVSSKNIAAMFQKVVEAYQEQDTLENPLVCEVEHVDGSMNASLKETKLAWLKANVPDNHCRILSNVRCLSEGVDVPALDAVMFLTPRNSQVDVVQSVGRVMRNAAGKKRGYVILPVVIPFGVTPEKALDDNKIYRVVWQVLQALRSHDDRFDAMVNKLDLIGKDPNKMEVIAITDKISKKSSSRKADENRGKNSHHIGAEAVSPNTSVTSGPQVALEFDIGTIERAIYAKIVEKCGNRNHWEEWANDIAKIAQTHILRISNIIENENNVEEIAAFSHFAAELRDDLNAALSKDEIIEMLAQHLITKPVFDALFEGYSFAQHNPMSIAMQGVLEALEKHHINKEADTLQGFYYSVKMRAEGITNAQGKQKIVVELYDKFFRNAFPKMTERLGIVYTPVEVVDFIIHSVNDVLKQEFGQTLGSKQVHIIDPFTGTGTFITRLMQSGLITKEQLVHKYKHEIHANEIVLLAYYIAAINIESVYHDIIGGDYQPFDGICLTDTFQLYEKEDILHAVLEENSARRKRQKNLDIRVIIGNPPYSAGQNSANDNNANIAYPKLDESIRTTYAANSTATNKNALYDSYIRAIRWASDRIKDAGVIGFVSNAGFIDSNSSGGLRKCLAEEFSSIYIFHLRGNQRTSGELSRKEGGKIFGSGSRAPIAISLLVKNPKASEHGKIYFYDIGDYLSQKEKLAKIADLKSIQGISNAHDWQMLTPDVHHDWLAQRDDGFSQFISLGDKKDKNSTTIFENYSRGSETGRDAWSYNFSKINLEKNISTMILFYNNEVDNYEKYIKNRSDVSINDFLSHDPQKISWTSSLKDDAKNLIKQQYHANIIMLSSYRPYTKQHIYFDNALVHRVGQMPRIFPNANAENLVICVTGLGTPKAFSALIGNVIPDVQLLANGQCFPLKLYELNSLDNDEQDNQQDRLFDDTATPSTEKYTVKDGISDKGLSHFQHAFPSETISKEDLFYYIYGLLHSEEYKQKYADNLTKELPRIPCVKTAADFWAFSKAGRDLAHWHINYETVEPYPVNIESGHNALKAFVASDYRVEKMKFGKLGKETDKSTVIYNHRITIKDIPIAAYNYIVNGKPALEWVMERQSVTTHKDSGIINDANDWAIETMNDAAYPLKLFQRVITVSLETLKIVNNLPKLDI